MKKLVSTILALSCISTLCLTAGSVKVGKPVPSLQSLLPEAKLPATRGKVVLVDFWASWCAPCRVAFPCLSKLQDTYRSRGLVVVGISVDEKVADYQSFVSKMRPSFSLAHDASHRAASTFGPSTMPSSYLIDRRGVVRHIHSGFRGAKTEAEYIAEIEALLAEKN